MEQIVKPDSGWEICHAMERELAAIAPLEKFGDDMLFLPAPDFGQGSKIGAASWQFGISSNSKHKMVPLRSLNSRFRTSTLPHFLTA